ncbi:MAG TPA: ABC transporter substrate-binding protein, partial [Aliicoccus persicus]|nr:ABC transporter substrate-binding protein [Aliicoccus persicus]
MRKYTLMLYSLIGLMLLVGCNNTEEAEVEQELEFTTISDAVGLSPLSVNDSASSIVIIQIYDTLFKRDTETNEIVPHLVEDYESIDDHTWEFKLIEDIKFHDGTPLNAEAVKYTFDELVDPERAAPRASLLEPVDEVEVIDEYTFRIHTGEPYGPLLSALAHVNASIVSPEADQNQDINNQPVGSGPFKLENWSSGSEIVLVKNEDYFLGEPSLEKVTMHIIPEFSSSIDMLETGQVDFIYSIPSEHFERLESLDDVTMNVKTGTPVRAFAFNMTKEPFNNLEFRQAVAHAIDREEYSTLIGDGGIITNSVLGPEVFGYDESMEDLGYEYDLDKSRELIEANDFGNEEVKIMIPTQEHYPIMGEYIHSKMDEAGFNVSIERVEWGTYLELAADANYDMTLVGWANLTGDGSELFYPTLHSDNIGASNRAQFNNSEFDQLVEDSRVTIDE